MENANITSKQEASIFRRESMATISKIKDIIQKTIIWTLVGGIVLGAMFILCGGTEAGEIIAKFVGTLFLLAAAALISFIEFNVIEKGVPSAQRLATFGVGLNILWTILWILATWGAFDIWSRGACRSILGSSYCPTIGLSVFGMFTLASTSLSGLGLFGSVTLNLFEGKKVSIIRPLKIASFACLAYTELHSVVRIFTSYSTRSSSDSIMGRLDLLASFVGFAWFVTFLIALVISRNEKNADEYAKKKESDERQRQVLEQAAANIAAQQAQQPYTPKTDEELRAEIEEKVRREMIEKEIRAKLEKEMSEKN
jgi:hypothetical protein